MLDRYTTFAGRYRVGRRIGVGGMAKCISPSTSASPATWLSKP